MGIEAEKRCKALLDQIRVDRSRMKAMLHACLDEIQKGLEIHKEDPFKWDKRLCDLMMLDCCFDKIPTGSETGVFYGMDFGGSNIRAIRATLTGTGEVKIQHLASNIRDENKSELLPEGVRDAKATATMLFDTLALKVKELMVETGDINTSTPIPLGFTFSFGCQVRALTNAISLEWSKGFATGRESDDPVIGQNVCQLLNHALERNNVPAVVNCVLNDTTGTMIAGGMERPKSSPPCLIGLIAGSGFNTCYFEPFAKAYNYIGNVINVESGGFSRELPYCVVDAEIDFESTNKGHQQLEKMTSGIFLPEVIRLLILKSCRDRAPPKTWDYGTLSTPSCAAIFAQDAGDPDMARRVMMEELDWNDITKEEAIIVKKIVDAAFERSAALVATVVAAMAKKTRKLQPALGGVTVGVDGSLYTKNVKYQHKVREYLDLVLGQTLSRLIHFQVTDDGSGKGAACLAGVIAQHRTQTFF